MEEKEPYQRTNPKQREKQRQTRWKVGTIATKKWSKIAEEERETSLFKQQTITT